MALILGLWIIRFTCGKEKKISISISGEYARFHKRVEICEGLIALTYQYIFEGKYYMNERRNVKRREFINQYLPYVKTMIYRYKRSLPVGMEVQDLVNSGVIGLLLAADRYEEQKAGKNFMSYANFRIRGEIIQALRTHDRFSKQMRERIKIYILTYGDLQQKLGRDPTDKEVMKKARFSEKQMAAILSVMSIDMDDLSSEKVSINDVDYLSDVDDLVNKISDKEIINMKLPEAISHLSDQEQYVIKWYFGLENRDEKLMREIAKDLNITESRISQIRTQALLKLKDKLNELKD